MTVLAIAVLQSPLWASSTGGLVCTRLISENDLGSTPRGPTMTTDRSNDDIQIDTLEDAQRWINILHRRSVRDAERMTRIEACFANFIRLPWRRSQR